jgi:glycolate oxidase FAD binding subunit
VIGMRMALPSGEIARSGGRVVKNVAGYDLAKLFIGSHGTLGVIVEAAFKIYPRPQVIQTLILSAKSEEEALQLGTRLRSLGPGLLVLAVLSPAVAQSLGVEGITVMVTVGGTAGTVQELAEEVRGLPGGPQARTLQDDEAARFHAVLRDFPGSATAKISTLPSETRSRLLLPDTAAWIAYPAVGLTYVRRDGWSAAEVEMLRTRLRERGGHAVLLHAAPQLKAEAGVWGAGGPERHLMRKVKDVFDPRDIMSPGRFVV